ncbi:hypothetical protein RJ639_028869 [Escallonia herrerae]|uniref:BRO1 domain-containing protein n=1 Tax=Escallonia herrerae TaxID=1293975 RepID=A0AA88X3A4_9ASTE|nr:hypothetical protein RJ639_028869 [Escallonia herrerae]
MGCTCSVYAIGRRKKKNIPQVTIFVPSLRAPVLTDLQRPLRGLIPKDLADRISSLRNQIVLVAGDTGGSAIAELQRALEEYLSLLIGLTEKDHGLQELVEFKWKNLEDERQGTEMQLSLAVESQNATLSVKRRLACEQLSYFGQAHYCLSTCNTDQGYGKKQLLFIKWKYLESKAAAYYYHGLIVDKGSEPSCHISAVCCFFASEELLAESKKVFLSFCLAAPVTRGAPPWGAMNHLSKKIPETASRKSQMYGYLLDVEKDLRILPELPEFQLSLKPDDYELPEMDSGWDHKEWEIPGQMLKEHLIDSEDEMETI